jgi:RND family efflux transporter MFP subunit
MKRNSWPLLALASIVLIGGYVGARAWWMNKCAGWLAANRAVPVKVEPARPGRLRYTLQARGELRPVSEAKIVARISGTVKEIHYQVGDSVSEGAVVAVVESTESLQRVATLEANLAAARSQLAEKERQLASTEKQFEKTHQWVNRDLIAKRELDHAQHETDTARAHLELAKAQAAQQEAMLAQSRKMLGLIRLTAPFGGLVTGRMVEPGSKVGNSDAILIIAGLDTLKATIGVPEKESSLVREGATAQVRLDESPADVLYGKVVRLNLPFEARGALVVEVHVPNRNKSLKPGAPVFVSFSSDSDENVLFVPVPALMKTGDTDYVYTVVDGRAQRKEVLKRGERDGKVAIKEGLREGESVVVWGQQYLSGDGRVRLLGAIKAGPTNRTWHSLFCSGDGNER